MHPWSAAPPLRAQNGSGAKMAHCLGNPLNYLGPPLNYLGPLLNYLRPPLNYLGPPLNYLGPLLNYVGPLLNYVGPHLNYLGSHLNYLGQLLNYNACVWYITNHYQPLLSAIISHYWGPCRSARRPRWTAAAGGGGRPGRAPSTVAVPYISACL